LATYEIFDRQTQAAPDDTSFLEGAVFKVRIRDNVAPWGKSLDPWPFMIEVVQLVGPELPPCLAKYNETAGAGQTVQLGDLITQVNEATDAKGMNSELRSTKPVTLTIARPTQLKVKIPRVTNEVWGLYMSYQNEQSECVLIKNIQDGAIASYNRSGAGPELKKQDLIQAVNGVTGPARVLLETMKASTALDLVLLRLPTVYLNENREQT